MVVCNSQGKTDMTERITLRLENPVQALADMRRAWGWYD